ncbi:MAG: tRNA 2-thiouridine(34) synthase MnmA [Chloroflexota bacterium]|nr:tRNA 2-thiouridine(34) synthase MnmA [Chloroflexota bacterium]
MARVLVAMSGGVDSSVAAALLAQAGHEVIGVTFNQWPASQTQRNVRSGCCTPRTIDDARHVCQILGAPHYVLNFRSEFEAAVIHPWSRAYLRGETPNPCVTCNDRVRFPELIRKADELGAEFVATGHYARVANGASWRLLRARDAAKDQSYVLHTLREDQLRRVRLPLGALLKPDVRRMAAEFDLPVAAKPDSQEICFVPDGDYAAVVRREGTSGEGPIVELDGREVGRHGGIETATIGQRRGLALGGGAGRRYVTAIDVERNALVVGPRAAAMVDSIAVRDVRWIKGPAGTPPARADVQTRSHARASPARLDPQSPSQMIVRFDEPAWAPAPGQAAVFYRGDEVLGGGVIERPEVG